MAIGNFADALPEKPYIPSMKALDQLRALAPSARKRLGIVMNSHGRESLRRLYEFLVKWKAAQDPTKEELHLAVYGKQYQASEDYLLRNELRLLSKEVMEVVAIEEFLDRYHDNPAFKANWDLRADIRLGTSTKPQVLSEVFLPGDHSYDQPGHLADGLEAWLKSAIETREIHRSTAEELIRAADLLIELRRVDAGRKLAQALLMQRIAYRWAQLQPQSGGDADAQLGLGNVVEWDPVTAFLYAQHRAQDLQGRERIAVLEEGLAQLRLCKPSKLFDREAKEIGFLAMIGLEWYLLGEYVRANAHYRSALAIPSLHRHPQWMAILTNFVSSLLKAGEPQVALELAEQHAQQFGTQPQAEFLLLGLKAMAHLFLDHASEAIRCIPPDIQQRRGSTYLLFRFVQPIAYMIQGDAEAAEREAHNIGKMIRYWQEHELDRFKELEIDHLPVAKWLEQYAQALQHPEPESSQRMRALAAAMEEAVLTASPLFRDYLPLLWLRKQVSGPQH